MSKIISFVFVVALLVLIAISSSAFASQSKTLRFLCDNGIPLFVESTGGVNVVSYRNQDYVQIDTYIFAAGSGQIMRIDNMKTHIKVNRAQNARMFNKKVFMEQPECQ